MESAEACDLSVDEAWLAAEGVEGRGKRAVTFGG
jgi:hypothetical protein